MQSNQDPRIHAMYAGDRRWALAALAVLWGSYLFVLWRILHNAPSLEATAALVGASGLVLIFNTAAIFAMLRHYGKDKEHIYGLDIFYLDANRKTKKSGG